MKHGIQYVVLRAMNPANKLITHLQYVIMAADCDGGGDGVRGGVRVQPLLQQAVHHLLHHHLHRPAGGGVRGELQEELLHPVQSHRLPGHSTDMQVSSGAQTWKKDVYRRVGKGRRCCLGDRIDSIP